MYNLLLWVLNEYKDHAPIAHYREWTECKSKSKSNVMVLQNALFA